MKTLVFENACPNCSPICLRDFWVTEAASESLAIYDVTGSSFKSKELIAYDEVAIGGLTFKVRQVKEVSSFGNTYWVYTVESGVVPNVDVATFYQPTGKIWNSGETWYYTGNFPMQLNWGFNRANPAWSITVNGN